MHEISASSRRMLSARRRIVARLRHGRYLRARRVLDVAVVVAIAPLAAPLLAATAIAIRVVSPGPVFIRLRRSGFRGRELMMLKLRTMSAAHTTSSEPPADEPGDAPLARWIRRHRLDELPQLWHVLTGEMALIGPRPMPPSIARGMAAIMPEYAERLDLRPGVTGLAQVRLGYGDDVVGQRHRLAYDLLYRDTVSPLVDLRILLATIRTMLFGAGEAWHCPHGPVERCDRRG